MSAGDGSMIGELVARGARRRMAVTKRTDGQDTAAVAAPAPDRNAVSRPGAQNSALKEAPTTQAEWVNPQHPARAQGVAVVDAEKGVVQASGRKKFAVCGFASSSRELIPVNDPTWEVWGLNQLYRHIKRADRWFDIHYYWEQEVVPGTEGSYDDPNSYRHWLARCGMPVYMHHTVPQIPTSVRFPLERIIARHEADYFTSTIAFMVALAIDEIDGRVDADLKQLIRDTPKKQLEALDIRAVQKGLYAEYTIGVFGVDLIVGEEYFWQKACAEYWLGAASARGITVLLPPMTALCKQQYRYGYEKEPDTIIKVSEVAEHKAALNKQRDEALRALYCIDGALQADEYWDQLLTLRLRGLGTAGK